MFGTAFLYFSASCMYCSEVFIALQSVTEGFSVIGSDLSEHTVFSGL